MEGIKPPPYWLFVLAFVLGAIGLGTLLFWGYVGIEYLITHLKWV